jgi:hypothetical protein
VSWDVCELDMGAKADGQDFSVQIDETVVDDERLVEPWQLCRDQEELVAFYPVVGLAHGAGGSKDREDVPVVVPLFGSVSLSNVLQPYWLHISDLCGVSLEHAAHVYLCIYLALRGCSPLGHGKAFRSHHPPQRTPHNTVD